MTDKNSEKAPKIKNIKICAFLDTVGAPNVKQSAKKIMAEYSVTKPQATEIATNLIDYDHKKKRYHPTATLDGIRSTLNDLLDRADIRIYLEAAA
ncbi:MAG: hypothetical protein JXR12_06655 [Neptunomonas phycophila]|uniref:hypothetical protein n=1 Tax=Neptunomonas phycophila TaxID=1572645 RepID=UPI003B8D031D